MFQGYSKRLSFVDTHTHAHTNIYVLFRFFSIISYYKILDIISCAIQ